MTTRINLGHLVVLLVLTGTAGRVEAQSIDVCGALPYVGATGPELCISIAPQNSSASPVNFRVPAGPGAAPFAITGLAVGEYTVNTLSVAYVSGPTGMAVGMTGTVTRTAPGNASLSIIALGGWGTPIPGGAGVITLSGASTGTSATIAGAAAGRPAVTFPAQDIALFGFPRTINATTVAAGPFADQLPPQPTPSGFTTVAAQLHVNFHLNNVGDSTTIPAGVGIAPDGVTPPSADASAVAAQPHFKCYAVTEHNPDKTERQVKLADQFGKVKSRIGRTTRICTPVDKNDEGIPDRDLHLVCYQILKGEDANRPVQTANQFGKARLDVGIAEELCVPSRKTLVRDEQKQEP